MADISPGPELLAISGVTKALVEVDPGVSTWYRGRTTYSDLTEPFNLYVIPAGGSYPPPYFWMRAWHTVLLQYVQWTVQNASDDTGAQSGYNPADLTDIMVLAHS